MGEVCSVIEGSRMSTSAMSAREVPNHTTRSNSVPVVNGRPKGRVTFLDLPLETQKQIIRHVPRKELFILQRLNSHFFSLATAGIYRKLNLNITNSGDEENGLPKSHAADAFQTILASEYDYGQHIKIFRIGIAEDNVDVGTSGSLRQDPLLMTRLLWDSKSDSSKFLNTALLLVARKAPILETFQWDCPIELSGVVYQALHKVASLRHLRVRLDVSPSPKMVIRHGLPPNSHPPLPHHHAPGGPTPAQHIPPTTGPSVGPSSTYPSQASSKANNIKRKKSDGVGGYNYWANSRAFSGFKTLNSLALMGMSNLDCLGEIAECIKASSGTLNSLTLSLSTDLARKARKPTPVNPELDDPSDTELEEDDMMDPMPPPASTTQPATNEADIRKEKLAQEGILAKIFDLQSVSAEGRKLEKSLSLAGGQCLEEEDRQAANLKLKAVLMSCIEDPTMFNDASPARLEQLRVVRDVADMCISKSNALRKSLKEQTKPSVPVVKKKDPVSKPLAPAPTGFEQSTSSSKALPVPTDWDIGPLSSTTSPLFDTGSSSSFLNGVMNGTPNFPAVSGGSFSASLSGAPASVLKQVQQLQQAQAQQAQAQQAQAQQAQAQQAQAQQQVQQMKAQLQAQQQAQAQQAQAQQQVQQMNAQLQAQHPQTQAYMSPYLSGALSNNPPSGTTLLPVPYANSHSSSPGSHDAPSSSSLYQSQPAAFFNDPSLSYDYKESMTSPSAKNGISSATKKTKSKGPMKKASPATMAPVVDSEDESDTPPKTPPSTEQPFFAAEAATEAGGDSMDIDMIHPDEDTADLGEDQETVAEADEVESATPRKKAKIGKLEEGASSNAASNESLSSANVDVVHEPEAKVLEPISPDEAMQAYIRATHGLHLEALSLEWVPLKASIVARALDLSILKRVTLLEVGSQDAFWTLLVRLQASSTTEIAFRSIHTDNVSLPFVKFLATFQGLEELFMHERGGKQEADAGAAAVVNIAVIRKMALQKHVSTLRRLMIRNERNDTWDVDTKTLHFLAYKGAGLIELACSLNMKTYHILMQLLAAFKNLYALHLIHLRSTDRNPSLQSECLSFAIDSLAHCPKMRIKYIALINQVIALESKPPEFIQTLRIIMDKNRSKDKKGKGKATTDAISTLLEVFDDSGSEDGSDVLADVMAGETKIKFTTNFSAAKDVKIFSKEVRGGKL